MPRLQTAGCSVFYLLFALIFAVTFFLS
uniref:Uncharacterized protein n=1 Tax=Arundo donax TaxID=35708 RepID=A0A0A9CCP7_ARUDO